MYHCDICGYQTNRQFNLIRHRNRKHDQEPSEPELTDESTDESNLSDESSLTGEESNDSVTTEVSSDGSVEDS